ncbi:MAG: hypothetical protein ACEQSE_00945 [Candidatus Aquirickettsiella gammari]
MKDNRNLVMGIGLMVGAYIMFQRGQAQQYRQTEARRAPLGVGSMPGSAGTGTAQVIGGILGSVITKMTGGGTASGERPTTATPAYVQDAIAQNNVRLSDPYETFNPEFVDYEFLGE